MKGIVLIFHSPCIVRDVQNLHQRDDDSATLTYICMFQCPHIIGTITTHQGCKTKRFKGYNNKLFLFWCDPCKDRYVRQNLVQELFMVIAQECQALRREENHYMGMEIC